MQENKDSRQNSPNWEAKARAFIKELKTPEDKALRWKALLLAAFGGLPFFLVVDFLGLTGFIGGAGGDIGKASVNLFSVSLPTLTLLWWFRTYDTRQQIQKTQESINANLFGMYLKMLRSENKEERVSGLLGVVRLKQKGFFAEEIDSATQQNLNLAEVNLILKDLSSMNFSSADFQKAILARADLSNVNLFEAKLSAANLISAKLSGANLENADLSGADLSGADLSGANLSGVSLENADLAGVNLKDANLMGANLEYTNLIHARLMCANLHSVILDRANLERADLSGANLITSNLKGASFKNAKYNKATEFPLGFNPEEVEMELVESPHRRKPSDEGAEGE